MTAKDSRARQTVERLAGRSLYDWQARLLNEHLLRGDVPDAVDVPTGLGKTTTMALWLGALAEGASLPRRLVYVVDRRAVVDQATTEAEALAKVVGDGDGTDAELRRIREGLGLADGETLPVSTLRGQHADNRRWLTEPGLPAIIVGTVDMIGSRLLFSGYGVSRGLRPMHAGLLGVDALVLLDEAHLVPPFEALLRQIQVLRRRRGTALPPFKLMSLSATGRGAAGTVFSLNDSDIRDDARARLRLDAAKRLRLSATIAQADLAASLAERAWALGTSQAAVLVFCNGRKTAQDVAGALAKRTVSEFGKDVQTVELLVGERRVLERRRLFESSVFQRFLPTRHRVNTSQAVLPAFLVATSAGEVGVDLDADHIVCDLVAWERMVQRLGRLNRRPEPAPDAVVEVFPVAADAKTEAETAIDAERLQTLRAPFEDDSWPRAAELIDVSARSLWRVKGSSRLTGLIAAATTLEPLHPKLTDAVVDAWAMTSLREHSGRPDVGPWIRGWIDQEDQTRVVWRRWFPLRAEPDGAWTDTPAIRKRDLRVFFEDEAPPHVTEVLEAPTHRVVDWLKKRANAWLQAGKGTRPAGPDEPLHRAVVLTLLRNGDVENLLDVNEIWQEKSDRLFRRFTGRTVIVDARLAGLSAAGMLDPQQDVRPQTFDDAPADWPGLAGIGYRVRRVTPSSSTGDDWRIEYRWRERAEGEDSEPMELRIEVWRGTGDPKAGDLAIARFAQELDAHCAAVNRAMTATANRLSLVEYLAVLQKVATHHDAGKARELWQRAMNAPRDGKVYGKTIGGGNPRLLQIGDETYRHEFGSLRNVVASGAFVNVHPDLRDFALHVIASHHGFARPTIAAVDPDFPPTMCAELAGDAALRFARLNRQWGAWELAWWEAIFRAADWKGSTQVEAR